MDLMLEHIGKGLILVLALSLPCVLVAASIGLVVGILQAVTQVQEQTIAAAPKIVCVFLVLLLGGGIMLNVTMQYVRESFILAFQELPKQGPFLMPPRDSEEGMQRARAFFHNQATAGNSKLGTVKDGGTSLLGNDGKGSKPTAVIKGEPGNPNSISERMGLHQVQNTGR